VETNSLATAETVYKAASLSKPFIAAATLLLIQEGKIGLDDKVSKYLEDHLRVGKAITISHLLTHTSGIVRDPVDYHPYSDQPITAVIRSVYPVPLSFPPGDRWLYSNVGYYALAEIITKVSGKQWDEFIAERLFAPARMTSTVQRLSPTSFLAAPMATAERERVGQCRKLDCSATERSVSFHCVGLGEMGCPVRFSQPNQAFESQADVDTCHAE